MVHGCSKVTADGAAGEALVQLCFTATDGVDSYDPNEVDKESMS
jgi:hypothetical protein